MLRRLVPGLLVAAVLMGAAYLRADDRALDGALVSHGAGACDPDGVTVGYSVTYRDDLSPRGYRVDGVTVDGISSACVGHEIAVALISDRDVVGRSWGTLILSETMSLPLRTQPLAKLVDGIKVTLDDDTLPPAPGPTATPTESTATPSTSPWPGKPSPPVKAPGPAPTTKPGLHRDPNGIPLPESECNPASAQCGTTGRDSAFVDNGIVSTGSGRDRIVVDTGAGTDRVDVHAGAGRDAIDIGIRAVAGSTQVVEINAGLGADEISLSFDGVEPGSVVHVVIDAGDGSDMIELAGSIPSGVSVRISAGSGSDVISAGNVTGAGSTGGPSLEPGGYRIYGEAGDDTLSGGVGADVIFGGSGSDVIAGRGGADELSGGSHGDVIRGGAGNDRLAGGRGGDSLSGGTGSDELSGGRGKDACRSGPGAVTASSCEGFAR